MKEWTGHQCRINRSWGCFLFCTSQQWQLLHKKLYKQIERINHRNTKQWVFLLLFRDRREVRRLASMRAIALPADVAHSLCRSERKDKTKIGDSIRHIQYLSGCDAVFLCDATALLSYVTAASHHVTIVHDECWAIFEIREYSVIVLLVSDGWWSRS